MHLPTTQKRRTCMTHIQPGCALIGWRDAAVGRSLFLSHQQLNNLQFYVTWWGILRSSVAVRSSQSPPPVLLRMGISRRIWKRKKQSFTLTCWIYAEERSNLLIKAKPGSTRQIICGWRVCALVLAYFSADIESFLENSLNATVYTNTAQAHSQQEETSLRQLQQTAAQMLGMKPQSDTNTCFSPLFCQLAHVSTFLLVLLRGFPGSKWDGGGAILILLTHVGLPCL